MRPRFDVITLGVGSIERSLAFYRDGLRWPTDGVVGTEFHDDLTGAGGAIAFLRLENGMQIALDEQDNLVKDAQIPAEASGAPRFSLIHQVSSREEADRTLGEAGGRRRRTADRAAAHAPVRLLLGLRPGPGRTSVGDRLE